MNEFMNKMYSYDNFGIYLILAIVILVILFFVILFFGKKDKKNRELEETKRLEKLNPDLFKDDSKEEKVEVVDSNVITPITNEVKPEEEKSEPVLPIVEDVKPVETKVVETPIPEVPKSNEMNIEPVSLSVNEPILEKEEEKPLVFNQVEDLPKVEEQILPEVEIPEPVRPTEAPKGEAKEELPEIPAFNPEEIGFDIDHILNNNEEKVEEAKPVITEVEDEKPLLSKETEPEKNVQVFSSVYVPEKEEIPVMEEPVNTKVVDDDEDDDFDLPQLKGADEKVEAKPVMPKVEEEIKAEPFNSVSIDSISGESYEIK